MSFPYRIGAGAVAALEHNPLWVPGRNREFMVFTILGGQTLLPGSVLGMITATRKLKLAASAAGDGSQVPMAILGEPLNTFAADGVTALDMSFAVAIAGYFNPTAVILGAGMVLSAVQDQLRQTGLYSRAPGYSG